MIGMLNVILQHSGYNPQSFDRYPHPREETTSEILTRALKLCPQLAPPEVRAIRPPQLGDLLSHVVGEGCGLRPARENGIRIESEWWDVQGKLDEQRTNGDRGDKEKVLVVYNYGYAFVLSVFECALTFDDQACGLWISNFLGYCKKGCGFVGSWFQGYLVFYFYCDRTINFFRIASIDYFCN